MRYVFQILLLFVSFSLYGFPKIQSTNDIVKFFPKKVDEVKQMKEDLLRKFYIQVEDLQNNINLTDEELLRCWDKAWGEIGGYVELLETMSMVMPAKYLRDACSQAAIEIQRNAKQILTSSKTLYDRFERMYDNPELSLKMKRYLLKILREFEAIGFNLDEQQYQIFTELDNQLTDLCSLFRKNIMEDQSSIRVKKEDLIGVNASLVDSFGVDESGNCVLYCDYPTVFPVLSTCECENTRKKMYEAFHNRAYPVNQVVLSGIIKKRDELAKLLGCKSFADFQLQRQMIQSSENAEEFLLSLLQKTKIKESEEFENLNHFLPAEIKTKGGKIEGHNISYCWNQYRMQSLNYDNERIAEFFPLETAMGRTVDFFSKFYDVEITQSYTNDLWSDHLTVLEVARKGGKLGYIVLDLFPRPNKYGHACMCPIIPSLKGKENYPSLCVVVTNFPKPTKDKPSLLDLENMRTLFHELGHAFHEVLGQTDMILTCGTRVAIDFVEMPSQLMEQFLYEPRILRDLSCHYQTYEPLDSETIMHVIKSRNYNAASMIQRQIFLSLISLKYFQEGELKDTQKIFSDMHQLCRSNYENSSNDHMQASFGHLEGYGASYYGYLFSKVLALDIYERFQEKSSGVEPYDRDQVHRYVVEIIGKGDSEDLNMILERYLDRKPGMDSFLQRHQIGDMEYL